MLRFLFIILISFPIFSATDNVIEVFGESRVDVFADTWDVHFRVIVKEKNKSTANSTYNKVIRDVKKELSDIGINNKKLITNSLFSSEWKEWKKNSYVVLGWRMNHSFSVKIENMDKTSELLSTLSKLKNVSINNINYGLKIATQKSKTKELFKTAYQDSMIKINAILSAMGKKMSKVSFVSENVQEPFSRQEMLLGRAEVSSSKANIELSPQKISLNLRLKVQAIYK